MHVLGCHFLFKNCWSNRGLKMHRFSADLWHHCENTKNILWGRTHSDCCQIASHICLCYSHSSLHLRLTHYTTFELIHTYQVSFSKSDSPSTFSALTLRHLIFWNVSKLFPNAKNVNDVLESFILLNLTQAATQEGDWIFKVYTSEHRAARTLNNVQMKYLKDMWNNSCINIFLMVAM